MAAISETFHQRHYGRNSGSDQDRGHSGAHRRRAGFYSLHAAEDNAKATATRIVQVIEEPFRFDVQELRSSLSIGIAVLPQDAADPSSALQAADQALYRSKRQGRTRFGDHSDLPL
ncbi:diguanylate cyclase domain-containing protein [Microvirga rosea]|uniref:diguanylate cyclase domain-containing protein n=1 Tax=Microvirga rosea TaxID=2715425 RepID=UPI0038734BEF